jgi:hypothetical protein
MNNQRRAAGLPVEPRILLSPPTGKFIIQGGGNHLNVAIVTNYTPCEGIAGGYCKAPIVCPMKWYSARVDQLAVKAHAHSMLMLPSQKLEVMVLMNLAGNSSTVIGRLSAPTQAPPLLPYKKGNEYRPSARRCRQFRLERGVD